LRPHPKEKRALVPEEEIANTNARRAAGPGPAAARKEHQVSSGVGPSFDVPHIFLCGGGVPALRAG
jgi:hypothetical protein